MPTLYSKPPIEYEEPYANYDEDNHDTMNDLDYDAPYNSVSHRTRVADYSEDIPEYDEEYPAEADE
jgi:hypothetical protein